MEKNRLMLVWEIMDNSDIFKGDVDENGTLMWISNHDNLEGSTRVCEQGHAPSPYIKLLIPRTARIVEHSPFTRVECRLPLTFRKILPNKELSKIEFPGLGLKISDGDILIMTPVPLAEGSFIVVGFMPCDLEVKNLVGQVARRIEHVQKKKRFYEYQVTFTTVLEADMKKLKKYVLGKILF